MKIYISADMEGVAGVTDKEEVNPTSPHGYSYFQNLMTREVAAAANAALSSGATEVWVRDAHWTGRNIIPDMLPKQTRLVRAWSGHPYSMVQELDSSFAAVLMIGYHSRAGSGGNPLAHTMSGALIAHLKLNGVFMSEFALFSYAASLEKVPVIFLSGDQALCEEARRFNERIETYATAVGHGSTTISVHPDVAVEEIAAGVKRALKKDPNSMIKPLPSHFEFEIGFKSATSAYANSFYPGARLKDDHTVSFETGDYFEVLRMLAFLRR